MNVPVLTSLLMRSLTKEKIDQQPENEVEDVEILPTAVAAELPLEERPTPIIAFEESDSNVVEIQPLAYRGGFHHPIGSCLSLLLFG